MKVFIVSALLLGLAIAQTETTYDARTAYCSTTNETSACANLTDACCGTVSTKVGTATATSVTRCISRHLTEDLGSVSYGSTTVTAVTYSCLNSTKATGYSTYANCTDSANCSSGYCCAVMNYTISSKTANASSAKCVAGSLGTTPGTNTSYKFNAASTAADLGVQTTCYSSMNSNFYSSAFVLKSAVALVFAGLLSLAF